MRKVLLNVAVSLDGFIEGPGGEYDWCFTDQDYGMSEFFRRVDSMFIGRKSYELLASLEEPDIPGAPELREYVFSTTLRKVKPGAILISENMESQIRKIKGEPGKDIWLFGGAELTSSLLNLGLVDELLLAVHPILLGSGKPLFMDINSRTLLKFRGSKSYSTGLISLAYEISC